MAIVATVHQPSSTQFSLFSSIYALTKTGKCAYYGSPTDVVRTLSLIGLNCPDFYNPADFLLEVANEELGKNNLHQLKHLIYQSFKDKNKDNNITGLTPTEIVMKTKSRTKRYEK